MQHDLAVVRRARIELRELPTATLRRVHELLDRALSEGGAEDAVIAELERELARRR